jgi:hypothetical protein
MQLSSYRSFLEGKNSIGEPQRITHKNLSLNVAQDFNPQMMSLLCFYGLCISMFGHIRFAPVGIFLLVSSMIHHFLYFNNGPIFVLLISLTSIRVVNSSRLSLLGL